MTRDHSFAKTPQTSTLLAILVPQTLKSILEGLWGGLPRRHQPSTTKPNQPLYVLEFILLRYSAKCQIRGFTLKTKGVLEKGLRRGPESFRDSLSIRLCDHICLHEVGLTKEQFIGQNTSCISKSYTGSSNPTPSSSPTIWWAS